MDDDLRLGTDFAAGLGGLCQQAGEARPVSGRRIGVADVFVFVALPLPPAHAVGDLIAGLDEVGGGPFVGQSAETRLGVVVDLGLQLLVAEREPGFRSPLRAGVGPGVAVVEVEQQRETFCLDALGQTDHVVEVLAHLRVAVAAGVDEQAQAQGIPAHGLALQVFQHVVDLSTLLVVVAHLVIFIELEHGDVASEEACLCHRPADGQ